MEKNIDLKLGYSLIAAGQFDEALNVFYYLLKAIEKDQQEIIEEKSAAKPFSKELINKYIELNNTYTELKKCYLLTIGILNLKLNNINSAIEIFSKVIDEDKTSAFAFYHRALAYMRIKKYSNALDDCSNTEYCINIANYIEDEEINKENIIKLRQDILYCQNNSDSSFNENTYNEYIINSLNKLFYNL